VSENERTGGFRHNRRYLNSPGYGSRKITIKEGDRAPVGGLQHARPHFPEDRVRQVRNEIAAAFPVAPPPNPAELAPPPDTVPETKGQTLFAGKSRDSLKPDFLKVNWAQLYGLSDAGRNYYLPAFLLASLGPESDKTFVHAIAYMLGPDWPSLYYGEKEPPQISYASKVKDSKLSPAAAKAVAAYLELLLECEERVSWETSEPVLPEMAASQNRSSEWQFKWLAAEALLWRWNRIDTPGLAKARAFQKRMTSYRVPEGKNPAEQDLLERIKTAFARTPAPAPDDMTGSVQGTEPFEYAVQFRGLDWKTLDPDFLSRNYASLSFFSDAAFRYFIPAYMIQDVLGSESNANPVFQLTYGLTGKEPSAEAQERFSHFSADERATIVAFLKHCAARTAFGQRDSRRAS